MGRVITALYADFAVPANVFVNSEQALFPGTNAAAVSTPNDPYKSGNAITTSEFLTFDFGAAVALPSIVIDHINVASVVLKGKATNAAWGSPTWTSGTKAVTKDGKDGRYKLHLTPSGSGSPFNYRYLRLEPATTTTTDGSSFFRVGCLLGLKVATEWPQNHGFPFTPQQRRAIDPLIRQGGGGEPSARGNRYAEIVIPASRYDNMAMEAIFDDIVGQADKPLAFFRNFGNDAEVYICHLINQPAGPGRRAPGLLEMGSMVFREVV